MRSEVHVIRLTSPFAKPRFWHHVFDIPRFRVWHKCNREFEEHEALGIEWCSTWLSGTAGSGWSLSLASFTSHRRALSWPGGAVTFSPHSALAPSARLTRRGRLVVLGQPPARGVSVAKVLLVLHAPRRPAVKPGMTPVELAAPRVRRARSARRLDNQSNATPRSWSGSRRRARDGRAREAQPIRCSSRRQ